MSFTALVFKNLFRQRARTLRPIMLADEPTGSLDSEAGRRVLELIEYLRRQRGLTIVLVTHDLDVAGLADRVVPMLDGRVAGDDRIRLMWPCDSSTSPV